MSKRKKIKKSLKKYIFNVLIILFVLLTGYFSFHLFFSYRDEVDTHKMIEKIHKEIVTVSADDTLAIDFSKLKEENSDTVGYLWIEDTSISYPVVQGPDNSYYLRRGFDKSYNQRGWIYMNSENHADMSDQNTVLFGHNTLDDTMFGPLLDLYEGRLGNNIQIHYDTEKEKRVYQVYSAYLASPYDGSGISTQVLPNFYDATKAKSALDFLEVTEKSKPILTLSTCYYTNKNRIIVHAILIESESLS